MGHSAKTIAKYILSLQDDDAGDLISNLKLQKLLYYCQGIYVAINSVHSPLFPDKIYAWEHGPVVKTVYREYRDYRKKALPVTVRPPMVASDAAVIDEVYRVFGKFSAWKLRQMTHSEMPWKKNYVPNELDVEIPLTDLAAHFKKYV